MKFTDEERKVIGGFVKALTLKHAEENVFGVPMIDMTPMRYLVRMIERLEHANQSGLAQMLQNERELGESVMYHLAKTVANTKTLGFSPYEKTKNEMTQMRMDAEKRFSELKCQVDLAYKEHVKAKKEYEAAFEYLMACEYHENDEFITE